MFRATDFDHLLHNGYVYAVYMGFLDFFLSSDCHLYFSFYNVAYIP